MISVVSFCSFHYDKRDNVGLSYQIMLGRKVVLLEFIIAGCLGGKRIKLWGTFVDIVFFFFWAKLRM